MSATPSDADLHRLLDQLYQAEPSAAKENAYLAEHGRPSMIDNQIRTFHWYRRYVPAGGTILDWGCNHGPDSCLMRAWFGAGIELHSCDFAPADRFPAFFGYSQPLYQQLTEEVRLPYATGQFDVVVGSGVLEHTAMDYESLKEVRRVLKPGGAVILSYLPNRWSVHEWLRRSVWRRDFHRRLYGRRETRQLLLHTGFEPIELSHHTFIWERLLSTCGLGRFQDVGAQIGRRIMPLHWLASTHCLIASKQMCM